jgi:hypothetical protein
MAGVSSMRGRNLIDLGSGSRFGQERKRKRKSCFNLRRREYERGWETEINSRASR